MKRVKIMLTAIILLGTVGGVLAIKAKRTAIICTAPVPPPGNSCAAVECVTTTTASTHPVLGNFRCTAATVNGVCPRFCPDLRRTIAD